MGKGKKKEKKDSNAPKRAITAFFFFQSERRPELKKEKPELDNRQLIYEMSSEWKAMSDDDKKKYQVKADEDRKRYEKEKAAYDAKNSSEKGKKKK